MRQRLWEGGGYARPLLSVLAGLLLAAAIMWASNYDVRAAYSALWSGATGLEPGPARAPGDITLGVGHAVWHLNRFNAAQSLARTTPLLFTGLSVAVGLRAGLFNIGAQGQMTMGALFAAVVGGLGRTSAGGGSGSLSPAIHVPLVMLAGILAGAVWGALPGLLKAKRGVHEVIATIMFNYIAVNTAKYLVTHDLKDPRSQAPQTSGIAMSAWLTPLVPGSNLTAGLLLALLAAAAIAYMMRRTSLGYEIRAVGQGAEAARANGISLTATMVTAMAISGGLAGLAGAVEVAGIHHRFIDGVAGNYGFDGIAVALLGGLNGSGIAMSALFFGMLANGAIGMQAMTDVPDSISVIVQAVVILMVGIRYTRKKIANVLIAAVTDTDEKGDTDDEY